ncbi:hypothetical protein, partial [Vibrio vulnificus]|uniref:hypothetical protein n=1 Tax=Vibrio vulnificus TaxID=672 RepID=UPI001A90F782
GSFTAFWLHNNEGRLARSCNPACSKSIRTWLRFGEIMRGSLSALFCSFIKHADFNIICLKNALCDAQNACISKNRSGKNIHI